MVFSTSRFLPGVVLMGGLMAFSACDKNDDPQTTDISASAEDQSVAEEENAAVGDLVEAGSPADITVTGSPAAEPTDLVRLAGSCFTRTFDAATRTLTLDFGAVNCLGPNGVARRGKIVAVFSGSYRQTGSTITVTLLDYYRNDNRHTGTRTITNLGGGSWSLNVQDASVTTSVGTHRWASQRQYTRTAGAATRTVLDDTYSVTGRASGTNRRGVSYAAIIEEPLIKKFQLGCARTFVAGTVSITNSKEKSMLLNYDPTNTQACDNLASLTINGKTWTVRCGR
jgi:hypothetical protein